MNVPDDWTRLTLTRRAGEAIRVDGPALLIVDSFPDNSVRIVVRAPQTTRVLREELTDEGASS